MTIVRFKFDPEKAIAALAFFARRLDDVDAMKAAKLLYFADKMHLLRHGRPILGDAYYGLEHGPVPTATYDLIKQVFADSINTESAHVAEILSRYLDVDRSGSYPRFVAKTEPDMDQLSASDVEALDETIRRYGDKTALELRQLAHEQPEVRFADEQRAIQKRGSVPIPFQLFFAQEKNRGMLSVVEDSQSERDFAESLHW